MSFAPTSAVHRQVTKASRRLFVQTLLDSLVWCWSAALLASVVAFLLQPVLVGVIYTWADYRGHDAVEASGSGLLMLTEPWFRWAIAGCLFVVATVVGVVLAWRRSPTQVVAALELDGRFQLRERVTTTLLLAPEIEQSPAGQALIADANERVAKLDVRTRFPVRLSWTALVVPGCALLLGAAGYLCQPIPSSAADLAKKKEERQFVPAKEVNQDVNNLKKLTQSKWFQNPKTEEDQKLKEEIAELLKIDPKNADQERELAQKIQQLKNDLQDRLDNLQAEQQKKKELQDELKKLGQDGPKQPDGPAKDVQNALGEGDAEKAAEKMKELADKLKNDKLDEKERKDLQKQLDDLKQQLNDVAEQKGQKDELNKRREELQKERDELQKAQNDLQKQKDDGKIDKQEFDKQQGELQQKQQGLEQKQQALDKKDAQLKENADKLKDLKDVAKDLEEAQKCLGNGECKNAGDKLGDAARRLEKLGGNNEQEMKQLKQGLGMGGGDPKTLDRPFAKEGKVGAKDEKQKGNLDKEQPLYQTGEQTGGTFKKIKASEVQGVFNQLANQDPAEVIERQQIREEVAPFVKGYMGNLGGSKKK
jgi:hypothetical protein